MFVSRQKKIRRLFKKDVFKVDTSNKAVIPKKISSSTQSFNLYFNNDKKKNSLLKHLPKLPRVSQGICSYFIAITQNGDNKNTKFYSWDIMQIYIEITFAIYHPHYKETLRLQNLHTTISLEEWVK